MVLKRFLALSMTTLKSGGYKHTIKTFAHTRYFAVYGPSSLLAKFLCVCLSVTTLAKASLDFTLRKRYVQHWYRLFSVLSSWIFEKTFREKANMLMSICLYRDITWRRCSDISPDFSKTGSFLVLSKSNGRLAAWNSKAASY